jgi:hypothetical protein
VVLSYRRRHLKRQADERDNVERCKCEAARVDLSTGQPLKVFIDADGMTESRTVSPKDKRNTKGAVIEVGSIANRVMGVEVICGPINTTFLYYTGDFTSKGSNLMVEVIRQALSDLRDQLALLGFTLPTDIVFSFDNCGENKNRTVFAYLALLVELRLFLKIEVYFLIVGHTHTPLDQYFSVLSRKINDTRFIGSPPAMMNLLKHAHANAAQQPTISKLIPVLYDVLEAFKDNLNNIKYHQTPHCFLFEYNAVLEKGTMKYKLFSDFQWQPIAPMGTVEPVEPVTELAIPICPLVGGWVEFTQSLNMVGGLHASTTLLENFQNCERAAQSNFMSDNLEEAECISPLVPGGRNTAPPQLQKGYIVMLAAPAQYLCSLPKVIDPRIVHKDVVSRVVKVGSQVIEFILTNNNVTKY